MCKAKGIQHGEKEQEGTAVRDKEMKEDIMGEKALRGRGALCPSIIICWVVSRKKLHQTAQGNFFPSPLCLHLLSLSNPCNERLQSVSALDGPSSECELLRSCSDYEPKSNFHPIQINSG